MTLIHTVGLIVSSLYLLPAAIISRHHSHAGRRLSGAAIATCVFAVFAFAAPLDTPIGAGILAVATALLAAATIAIRMHQHETARGTYAAYRADDRAVAHRRRP